MAEWSRSTNGTIRGDHKAISPSSAIPGAVVSSTSDQVPLNHDCKISPVYEIINEDGAQGKRKIMSPVVTEGGIMKAGQRAGPYPARRFPGHKFPLCKTPACTKNFRSSAWVAMPNAFRRKTGIPPPTGVALRSPQLNSEKSYECVCLWYISIWNISRAGAVWPG